HHNDNNDNGDRKRSRHGGGGGGSTTSDARAADERADGGHGARACARSAVGPLGAEACLLRGRVPQDGERQDYEVCDQGDGRAAGQCRGGCGGGGREGVKVCVEFLMHEFGRGWFGNIPDLNVEGIEILHIRRVSCIHITLIFVGWI